MVRVAQLPLFYHSLRVPAYTLILVLRLYILPEEQRRHWGGEMDIGDAGTCACFSIDTYIYMCVCVNVCAEELDEPRQRGAREEKD